VTHDPLCPCQSHKQPHIQYLSGVCHYCQCDLIAKVRADEREQTVHDCISAVNALGAEDPWPSVDWGAGVNGALAALEALRRALRDPIIMDTPANREFFARLRRAGVSGEDEE